MKVKYKGYTFEVKYNNSNNLYDVYYNGKYFCSGYDTELNIIYNLCIKEIETKYIL